MAEIANNSIDIQVVETGKESAQYFWHNTTDSGAGEGAGAHITQTSQDDFVDDPANGGGNTLINSGGLYVRNGTDVRAAFGSNAITLYTADGVPAFVVNSGSGSSSQEVIKEQARYTYVEINKNYNYSFNDLSQLALGTQFDLVISYDYYAQIPRISNTFTKGTSSSQTYTIPSGTSPDADIITLTVSYDGNKTMTYRATSITEAGVLGTDIWTDYISYTATVNDATTEVSGNMVWKNPSQVFVVDDHTKNSISVNNYTQGTYDISKAGYYPVGVVGYLSSSSYVVHATCYLSDQTVGSATINYYVSNTSSSSRTTNITWYVLWIKAE